jgi:DHA1 family multidrug resistance protein-like MFS transporter
MENNPKSTSTGIFNSTLAISNVIGPVIAGTIGFYYNSASVMYFAVVLCVAAFAISLKIKK